MSYLPGNLSPLRFLFSPLSGKRSLRERKRKGRLRRPPPPPPPFAYHHRTLGEERRQIGEGGHFVVRRAQGSIVGRGRKREKGRRHHHSPHRDVSMGSPCAVDNGCRQRRRSSLEGVQYVPCCVAGGLFSAQVMLEIANLGSILLKSARTVLPEQHSFFRKSRLIKNRSLS